MNRSLLTVLVGLLLQACAPVKIDQASVQARVGAPLAAQVPGVHIARDQSVPLTYFVVEPVRVRGPVSVRVTGQDTLVTTKNNKKYNSLASDESENNNSRQTRETGGNLNVSSTKGKLSSEKPQKP